MYVQEIFFENTLIEVCSPYLYVSFGTFCAQIGMFENRQIAVSEGKCRRFRNSSECLNTHCDANK